VAGARRNYSRQKGRLNREYSLIGSVRADPLIKESGDVNAWRDPGVLAALGAALLFGIGTPAAKLLLGPVGPWLLAGLLYAGSGIGLALVRARRRDRGAKLQPREFKWLAGAIVSGGVVGPVLLMWGLAHMRAAGASLLLNAETVFTALLAWFVFRENFDRRILLGMGLILAGALVLSWPGSGDIGAGLPALAVLGACLAWAIDNNLTRKVSLGDAVYIAMVKGLAAGVTNLVAALLAGAALPPWSISAAGAALGFVSYGLSLVLFVIALRRLGTARTGAYYSVAPFAGAVVAVMALGEPLSVELVLAGALMAAGVWLHLTEVHAHGHSHEALEHEHEHTHDAHHRHDHAHPVASATSHTHRHIHEPMAHSHPHFPDMHHRHEHD
jgi:drug/metabolite transporter (DMT)-like permease